MPIIRIIPPIPRRWRHGWQGGLAGLRRWPSIVGLTTGLVLGLASGLLIGWVIWPVEWTGTFVSPAIYLYNVADLFAFNRDIARLEWALAGWDYQPVLCDLYAQATDEGAIWRLATVQFAAGVSCP